MLGSWVQRRCLGSLAMGAKARLEERAVEGSSLLSVAKVTGIRIAHRMRAGTTKSSRPSDDI